MMKPKEFIHAVMFDVVREASDEANNIRTEIHRVINRSERDPMVPVLREQLARSEQIVNKLNVGCLIANRDRNLLTTWMSNPQSTTRTFQNLMYASHRAFWVRLV